MLQSTVGIGTVTMPQSQSAAQRARQTQKPKPNSIAGTYGLAPRLRHPMIIIRPQPIRRQPVRGVVDRREMPVEQFCVLPRFHILPKTFLPAWMIRVIVILMDG